MRRRRRPGFPECVVYDGVRFDVEYYDDMFEVHEMGDAEAAFCRETRIITVLDLPGDTRETIAVRLAHELVHLISHRNDCDNLDSNEKEVDRFGYGMLKLANQNPGLLDSLLKKQK